MMFAASLLVTHHERDSVVKKLATSAAMLLEKTLDDIPSSYVTDS